MIEKNKYMWINCKSNEHNQSMSLYSYHVECNEGCVDDAGNGLSFENKRARKQLVDKLIKSAESGNSFAAQRLETEFGIDRDYSPQDSGEGRGLRTFQ